jgi:hypothetical protein
MSAKTETKVSYGDVDLLDDPDFLTNAIPVRKAIQSLPSTLFGSGRPLHVSAAHRWIITGIRAANGTRVKLRAVRLPGGFMTTAAWMKEFLAALQPRTAAEPQVMPRTTARRRRDHEQAERELAQIGI